MNFYNSLGHRNFAFPERLLVILLGFGAYMFFGLVAYGQEKGYTSASPELSEGVPSLQLQQTASVVREIENIEALETIMPVICASSESGEQNIWVQERSVGKDQVKCTGCPDDSTGELTYRWGYIGNFFGAGEPIALVSVWGCNSQWFMFLSINEHGDRELLRQDELSRPLGICHPISGAARDYMLCSRGEPHADIYLSTRTRRIFIFSRQQTSGLVYARNRIPAWCSECGPSSVEDTSLVISLIDIDGNGLDELVVLYTTVYRDQNHEIEYKPCQCERQEGETMCRRLQIWTITFEALVRRTDLECSDELRIPEQIRRYCETD